MDKDAAKAFAKEFVQFNERCFARLLGDIRSYNFAVRTNAGNRCSFRIRAIDFDQQSYEGRLNLYLPQFFKENYPLVKLVQDKLSPETVEQYRKEERTLIARRIKSSRVRLKELLDVMTEDNIAPAEKITQLKTELAAHYNDNAFLDCRTMGQIVRHSLEIL